MTTETKALVERLRSRAKQIDVSNPLPTDPLWSLLLEAAMAIENRARALEAATQDYEWCVANKEFPALRHLVRSEADGRAFPSIQMGESIIQRRFVGKWEDVE